MELARHPRVGMRSAINGKKNLEKFLNNQSALRDGDMLPSLGAVLVAPATPSYTPKNKGGDVYTPKESLVSQAEKLTQSNIYLSNHLIVSNLLLQKLIISKFFNEK